MSRYYGLDSRPITRDEWLKLIEQDWKRRVGLTRIKDAEISTVWLGTDHSFGDGPPVLFETMIFGGEHDDFTERYHTLEEARAGHERIIRALINGETP